MANDRARTIGYWLTTGLLGFAFVGGGIMDLQAPPELVQQFNALGYPTYLLGLLGVAKLLGAAAILAPKLPRLKEWAYAGVTFDLLGAAYSHYANGDAVKDIITPLVIVVIAFASYFLRPASRRLPDPS